MLASMKYILHCAHSSLVPSPNPMLIACYNYANILLFFFQQQKNKITAQKKTFAPTLKRFSEWGRVKRILR